MKLSAAREAIGSGDGVAQPKPRAGEAPLALSETVTQHGDRPRPVRRTQGGKGDSQFVFGHVAVDSGQRGGLNEGSAFIGRSSVVRLHKMHEIAFGLVGHRLDEGRQAPTFWDEFHQVRPGDGLVRGAFGHGGMDPFERGDARERVGKTTGGRAMGDLEAPHSAANWSNATRASWSLFVSAIRRGLGTGVVDNCSGGSLFGVPIQLPVNLEGNCLNGVPYDRFVVISFAETKT